MSSTQFFEAEEAEDHRHRMRCAKEAIAQKLLQAAEDFAASMHSRKLRERNFGRPSIILGAKLTQYLGPTNSCGLPVTYVAEHCGIFGSGGSPDDAYHAFDQAWIGRE